MKTIQTQSKELIVVEVPEGACDFRFAGNKTFLFCTINSIDKLILHFDFLDFKILGKLSELSEEECSRFVEVSKKEMSGYYSDWYKNYTQSTFTKSTAKESLISLLQSHGVDTTKNLLLIEKI